MAAVACRCGHYQGMRYGAASEGAIGTGHPILDGPCGFTGCPCLHYVPAEIVWPKLPPRLPTGMRAA